MGGRGSTRWSHHTKATTVEECLTVDVKRLCEVEIGEWDRITWSFGNPLFQTEIKIATLAWRRTPDRIGLVCIRPDGRKHVDVISLAYTPCHLGGQRTWLICPGCGHRIAKLYLPDGEVRFLCRGCHVLTYRSCRESGNRLQTLARRIKRLSAKLGEPDAHAFEPVPPKPKGMHWKTYTPIAAELLRLKTQEDDASQNLLNQWIREETQQEKQRNEFGRLAWFLSETPFRVFPPTFP